MKHARIVLVTTMLLISFLSFNTAFGQSTQSSYTVKLNSYSLQVTYPTEVMPGDNVKMTIELIMPIAMEEQLRFAIREGGRTVGAGVVSKVIE